MYTLTRRLAGPAAQTLALQGMLILFSTVTGVSLVFYEDYPAIDVIGQLGGPAEMCNFLIDLCFSLEEGMIRIGTIRLSVCVSLGAG